MKLKNLYLFNVFFFWLPEVVALMMFPNITLVRATTKKNKNSKKTPHFDEKSKFTSIFKKTERKFWQKHLKNFGFLGTKFHVQRSNPSYICQTFKICLLCFVHSFKNLRNFLFTAICELFASQSSFKNITSCFSNKTKRVLDNFFEFWKWSSQF